MVDQFKKRFFKVLFLEHRFLTYYCELSYVFIPLVPRKILTFKRTQVKTGVLVFLKTDQSGL